MIMLLLLLPPPPLLLTIIARMAMHTSTITLKHEKTETRKLSSTSNALSNKKKTQKTSLGEEKTEHININSCRFRKSQFSL